MSQPTAGGGPKQPAVVTKNIEAVANLEQQFLRGRSKLERAIDGIADFTGSMKFVIAHVVWFGAWCFVNVANVLGIPHFDPFPFVLMSMLVSCEAVILTALVLMKQNRMGRHAEEREHLHLQINLLAEQEITKIIQTLQVMCKQMGIEGPAHDADARELSQDTVVHRLAQELHETIRSVSES